MSMTEAPVLNWRKSQRSGANGNCVEVAMPAEAVMVRDSKDPAGPVLSFSGSQWTGFVRGLRAGRFEGA